MANRRTTRVAKGVSALGLIGAEWLYGPGSVWSWTVAAAAVGVMWTVVDVLAHVYLGKSP